MCQKQIADGHINTPVALHLLSRAVYASQMKRETQQTEP